MLYLVVFVHVLSILGKIPSDVGLQGILSAVQLWHSLAISLGVPIDYVKSCDSETLGGILALRYWRDGNSGILFPPTWRFLLEKLKRSKDYGPRVADVLEKEVQSNQTWSTE